MIFQKIYKYKSSMQGVIIGLGHGDRVISQAFKLAGFNLLGVFSKNSKKTKKYSEDNNLKKRYNSIKKICEDKEVNLVAIAVPPKFQKKIIQKCIKYKKNIFCEKPLSNDYKNLKNIFKILETYKKSFVVDYFFREHKAFQKFKKLIPKNISKDSIIKIKFKIQSYAYKNRLKNWKLNDNLGGGLINLYLPHIIDYIIFFFGPIKYIKYKKYQKSKSEINISLKLQNECTVNIIILANSKKKIHQVYYEDEKNKFVLKNNQSDYGKNFKITKTLKKIDNNNSKKIIDIDYDKSIDLLNYDSRIFLTSILLKKICNKSINMKTYLKRLEHIEYVLQSIRDFPITKNYE